MQLVQESPDVFVAEGDISMIGKKEINQLASIIENTPKKRARINLHHSSDDSVHEMFIAMQSHSYVRPHKHPNKTEAFHFVHGSARIVIYDDNGNIVKVVHLDADHPDKSFYYRLSKPYFHTLLIDSDILIMHEITNGPFIPGATIFAPFSPDESDTLSVTAFLKNLHEQLKAYS